MTKLRAVQTKDGFWDVFRGKERQNEHPFLYKNLALAWITEREGTRPAPAR